MVNDVIGGHVTSKFLNILCKFFLLSSKNMRQHLFVKYVKTKLSFGPNGRKIVKIYHRAATDIVNWIFLLLSIYNFKMHKII